MMTSRRFVVISAAAFVLACSGTSREGPTSPSSSGLGRMPSAPIAACSHARGTTTLAADATPSECHTDADCTTGQNGRCLRLSNHGGHGPALEATRCSYDACFVDADCAAQQICVCATRAASEAGEGNSCAGSECASDAECGDGGYCRRTDRGNICHTLEDRCVEETNCGDGMICDRPSPHGAWGCVPFTAPVG